MPVIASSLTALIAAQHLGFLYVEMFAWETKGPKVFRMFHKDLFPKTTAMAANQGLYNGFLAGGLLWSLCITEDNVWRAHVANYFLGCVVTAGLYGWRSLSKRVFYAQGMPAVLGLVAVYLQI